MVWPTTGKILIFVKADPSMVRHLSGFTRDCSNLGHIGTGDLEITLSKAEDLDKARSLIELSYGAS
jgi:predicted transport protein